MSFKISKITHIKLSIYSLLGVILFYPYAISIIDNYYLLVIKFYGLSSIFIIYMNIIMLLIIITVIHELIHGLLYIYFGGKVKFGFKLIYAYTMETSSLKLTRVKFLMVLMSPLVLISILSMFMGLFGGIIFLLNLIGSSGDIYMATTLFKVSSDKKIVDRPYGYDVI